MKRLFSYIWHRERALLFQRNPARAFFLCIYPFIIMGVLWAVFWGESLTQILLAVVDESQGVYSRELVRALRASQFLDVAVCTRRPESFKQRPGIWRVVHRRRL